MSYVEGWCRIVLPLEWKKVKNKTGGMGFVQACLLSTNGCMDIDVMFTYDHSSGLFSWN